MQQRAQVHPGRPRKRILIVEDDPVIAELLERVIEGDGHEVRSVATGAAARAMVEIWRPDLITLDLILPDEDGLVVCRSLKTQVNVPILVCSATRRAHDALLSLNLGADDFVSKPFDIYDLTARLNALLRRSAPGAASMETPDRGGDVVRIDELVVDWRAQTVTVGGQPLALTRVELRLLAVLAERPGQVLPRESLAEVVWGQTTRAGSRTVDVHAGRLRAKLARAGRAAPTIVSVRGFGYKLVPSEQG